MALPRLINADLGVILMTDGGHLAGSGPRRTFQYPEAPRSDAVDDYHGREMADPYRPLEEPDAPATRAWIEAENNVTFRFLETIPERGAIRERLREIWDYEKYSAPAQEGGRYFYSYNPGLLNQSILYTTDSVDDDSGRVLLDPNTLSADGTVALSGTAVSQDGHLLAYGIAAAGSDWNEWKVRDVATGLDYPEHIRWVKFSGVEWTPDTEGFYYGRFPEPAAGEDLKGANYYQRVYYHRIGTDQAEDRLVWEDPDHKEWRAIPQVTDDGEYLILTLEKGTDAKYRILYRALGQSDRQPIHLVGDFDAEYEFIDNDGPIFWFKTNRDAPRGKVVAIDIRQPEPESWVDVIAEASETLEHVNVVADHFLAVYLKDAHSVVRVFDLQGQYIRDVEFPGIGTAGGFHGKRKDRETFYSFASFTTPATIYRYDVATGQSTVWRRPQLRFDPAEYETTQVFYASKDGTRVPMFLSYKKGLTRDGTNPALLYGYGGFNIALTPGFSPSVLAWMEMGGLYAVANLRGGGEYGEDWHQAGTKLNKQNVFDDFIAAAEWLIANQYTSSSKLAISGGSNGGLLVGACMTQRPDLFGAAMPAVGVMDMLRFHKFTIGWAWVDDYGSSEDKEQFEALIAYSPLHNIKPGTCYPPTLITTADHDDRVVPAHSFKFAAALQAAQACDNPVLIRIETKAGHGAGKPTAKLIEEAADKWAFLVKVLRISHEAARRRSPCSEGWRRQQAGVGEVPHPTKLLDSRLESAPRPALHVLDQPAHPFVFLVFLQKALGDEIGALMADLAPEGHPVGKIAVGHFGLDGSSGIERPPVPLGNPSGRGLDPAAERPSRWPRSSLRSRRKRRSRTACLARGRSCPCGSRSVSPSGLFGHWARTPCSPRRTWSLPASTWASRGSWRRRSSRPWCGGRNGS